LAHDTLTAGQQFFKPRERDFGYSNTRRDLRIWDDQARKGDVVRVIRTFGRMFVSHPLNS